MNAGISPPGLDDGRQRRAFRVRAVTAMAAGALAWLMLLSPAAGQAAGFEAQLNAGLPAAAAGPAPAAAPTTGVDSDGPNAALVTLAPGDLIAVTVYGRPELATTTTIGDDGRINAPLIGLIDVGGLSLAQAAERIATEYRDRQYLVDPQVNIVLSEARSQQITVLGEVGSAGRYPLETRTTILDALALAGGIGEMGAQRVYILRRKGEGVERMEIDLRGVLDRGTGEIPLVAAGDTLIVPKAEVYYLHGEVRSPNVYVLKPDLTLIEALTIAGGVTERGSTGRIEVRRKTADGEMETESIDLDDPIRPDDVIRVKERLF